MSELRIYNKKRHLIYTYLFIMLKLEINISKFQIFYLNFHYRTCATITSYLLI